MKVRFDFPRGYLAEMTQAREENDFDGWVDRKFGERIRDLISNDFTLAITAKDFVADFTYEDDAYAFLKTFGGRAIE
ncbi:hypothetical protein [Shinella sp.]|uniref:hypothetical protein n=1 Tax=Shinella sp. TaxID=1870904 RepID=UPI0040356A06